MKLSDLVKLLRKEISVDSFREIIKEEVSEYEKKLNKKGSSITMNLNEDCSFEFGKHDLLQLSHFYLNNDLKEIEINFIVDCLILSESVQYENDFLFELLEEMTDPEINGKITKEQILKNIQYLES